MDWWQNMRWQQQGLQNIKSLSNSCRKRKSQLPVFRWKINAQSVAVTVFFGLQYLGIDNNLQKPLEVTILAYVVISCTLQFGRITT
jgi:hypothetical protein